MLLSIVYGIFSYVQQINLSQSLYDTSIYPLHQGNFSHQGIVRNSIFFSFHIQKYTPTFHGLLLVQSGYFSSFFVGVRCAFIPDLAIPVELCNSDWFGVS